MYNERKYIVRRFLMRITVTTNIKTSIIARHFRYVWVKDNHYQYNKDAINENIDNLYQLILFLGSEKGRYFPYNDDQKKMYFTAGKNAIKREANRLKGNMNGNAISAKQISGLVKKRENYVKIPYYSEFIFKAIFSLAEKRKDEIKQFEHLNKFVDELKRDTFYLGQTNAYNSYFSSHENDSLPIHRELSDVLNADKGPLGGRF